MNLKPKEIVKNLDHYIVGQTDAKKAVAIALRNRYRRSQLSDELREEITPKNIILKGPTGVGKTEIARRLAKLVKAPFIKVEATKFTEVGYVGRDCESMIRDLVEVSVRMIKDEKKVLVTEKASIRAEEKLVEALLLSKADANYTSSENKAMIKEKLAAKAYEDESIEIDLAAPPKNIEIIAGAGSELNIGDLMGGIFPNKKKKRKLTVREARNLLIEEESEKLLDYDSVNSEAIKRAEQEGIIFIDEIDKIAGKGSSNNQDVSREGVQRDILPFVEGCTVNTKYGIIKTDFILFIAAGAFHIAKQEDLIPELQGRFPIRVELSNLTKDDFYKILKEPKNALTKQYTSLLEVDNIKLEFDDSALEEISSIAERENEGSENIGARRLHTILEKVLEDISFNASGEQPMTTITINREFIAKIFEATTKKYDLNKFII